MNQPLAFGGLGNIGSGVAPHLRKAGLEATVWDVSTPQVEPWKVPLT